MCVTVSGSCGPCKESADKLIDYISMLRGKDWQVIQIARGQEKILAKSFVRLHGFVVLQLHHLEKCEYKLCRLDWGHNGYAFQEAEDASGFKQYFDLGLKVVMATKEGLTTAVEPEAALVWIALTDGPNSFLGQFEPSREDALKSLLALIESLREKPYDSDLWNCNRFARYATAALRAEASQDPAAERSPVHDVIDPEALGPLFAAVHPAPLSDSAKEKAKAWHTEKGYPCLADILASGLEGELIEMLQLEAQAKDKAQSWFQSLHEPIRADLHLCPALRPLFQAILPSPLPQESISCAVAWHAQEGFPAMVDVEEQGRVGEFIQAMQLPKESEDQAYEFFRGIIGPEAPQSSQDSKFMEWFTVPRRISTIQANTLQHQTRERAREHCNGDISIFFPKVVISFATGRRSTDDVGAGPGIVYAAGLMRVLFGKKVPSFSGLTLPVGEHWQTFHNRIESRGEARAKVMVCILTQAFYSSIQCLQETALAARCKIPVIGLRFEHELPSRPEQWLEVEDYDHDLMVRRAQNVLAGNWIPPRGVFTDSLDQNIAELMCELRNKTGLHV